MGGAERLDSLEVWDYLILYGDEEKPAEFFVAFSDLVSEVS